MRSLAILVVALPLAAQAQNVTPGTIGAAGYLYPSPVIVAPGQVITLFVAGFGGQLSVTVRQTADYSAPVLDVRATPSCIVSPDIPCAAYSAVTVQIPFEIQPSCPLCANPVSYATTVFVTQNGVAGPTFQLLPLSDKIHFLTACDTVVPGGSGYPLLTGLPCAPIVTHADGSLVTIDHPAHGDEELVAYATGLGATNPAVPTGQPAPGPAPAQTVFLLESNYLPNALPAQPIVPLILLRSRYQVPLFAGLTAGYVGLYQVNFLVQPPPAGVIPCGASVQSNLTVSMGGQSSFDGVGICVTPTN